jgi:2,4-diketo-3-deoxy-L-fuconate hydrolase
MHAGESGTPIPATPPTFHQGPVLVDGPYGDIVLPSGTVDREVELVVVTVQTAFGVSADDAWSHVAGVTIGQDLSDRVVQLQPAPFRA